MVHEKLSKREIQVRSEKLLNLFSSRYFFSKKPTSLSGLQIFLTEKYGICFDTHANLGFNEKGEKILGACNIVTREILIDTVLETDMPKFNFTLAHELGHLALHRKLCREKQDFQQLPDDTIESFSGRSKKLDSEKDWLEWQANYYAISLLMPEQFLLPVLLATQQELGINNNRGKIFVDNQSCNMNGFIQTLTKMANYFRVSKTAVEYRLQEFGLIDDRRKFSFHIREALEGLKDSMY